MNIIQSSAHSAIALGTRDQHNSPWQPGVSKRVRRGGGKTGLHTAAVATAQTTNRTLIYSVKSNVTSICVDIICNYEIALCLDWHYIGH